MIFYFFLVANPDADLIAAMQAGPSTPEDLGELVAKQTPGEDNAATNFLMTSDRVNVTVKSKQSTTIPNSIKLIRVAARFDFYNKIEGLVIDKITFNKRYTTSHLFAQVKHIDGLTSTKDKTYDGTLFKGDALTGTIYGYETDTRGETYFTIEATYKGKPLNPEVVRLENFVIKRNHLYNIILHELGGAVDPNNPGSEFGKLKYEVKVADWEEGTKVALPEDDIQKSLRLDYDAELANAPYMTPYLKDSQKDIYTTTKAATEVTFKLYTYVREGSIDFKEGYSPATGVKLEGVGHSVKDPATGRITQIFKLTLPAQSNYVSYNKFDGSGKLETPKFLDVPLVAKNSSSQTTRELTVNHGIVKMPLEYFCEKPLNKAGDNFATVGNKVSKIGYFRHNTYAIEHFKDFEINGKKYHMPHPLETPSIIPYDFEAPVVGGGDGVLTKKENQIEELAFPCWIKAGNTGYYSSKFAADYRTNKANHVSYALRYKNETKYGLGNTLVMAFRYEWIGDFKKVEYADDVVPSHYKISCRYLEPNWNGNVDAIANEDFWSSHSESDVTKKIYAMAGFDGERKPEDGEHYNRFLGRRIVILTSEVWKENSDYALVGFLSNENCNGKQGYYANRKSDPKRGFIFPVWLFSYE